MKPIPTTVTGYAATYGRRPAAEFYFEGGPFEIMPGAFDAWVERIQADGLPMCRNHDLDWIVGRWTEFRTDDIGLVVTGHFDKTVEGKKAAIMFRQGTYKGLSLGKAQCHAVQGEDGVWQLQAVWAREITLARQSRDPGAIIIERAS